MNESINPFRKNPRYVSSMTEISNRRHKECITKWIIWKSSMTVIEEVDWIWEFSANRNWIFCRIGSPQNKANMQNTSIGLQVKEWCFWNTVKCSSGSSTNWKQNVLICYIWKGSILRLTGPKVSSKAFKLKLFFEVQLLA